MTHLDPYLALVNKQHVFHKSLLDFFEMKEVVDEDGKTYIEKETYKALGELTEFLENNYEITLVLRSAGRTPEKQQMIMQEQIDKYGKERGTAMTAKPGETEHHLGTALDVIPYSKKLLRAKQIFDIIPENRISNAFFRKDELYGTLHKHLEQFGFILRYTKDKEEITGYPAERWHIRYVGKDHAKIMNEGEMCLEEYVEFLKAHQSDFS